MIGWSQMEADWLRDFYPRKGRDWCARQLGKTIAQVRSKASRMGLRARGVSEAWQAKQQAHSALLTGRKRPAQAEVMRALHTAGKLRKTQEQRKAIGRRTAAYIAANGHPRGAAGIKHSDETKAAIGNKSRRAWKRMSRAQKQERTVRMMRTRAKNGTIVPPRIKQTWKAGYRAVGAVNKYFRSRWEANYARYLQWLKEHGQIAEWEHEPETFWFEGIKRGTVSYLPDFRVTENDGRKVYHEVKGWMDNRSATKLKRMKKYHPNVTLLLIDSKAYKALERKVGRLVAGWE